MPSETYIKDYMQGKIKKMHIGGKVKVKFKKGEIVNKSSIIKQGEFTKEEYEGLLAASDSKNGIYNIALIPLQKPQNIVSLAG